MAFEGTKLRSTRNGGTPVDGSRDDLAQADVVQVSLVSLPQQPSTYEWLLVGRPELSTAGGAGSNPWPLGSGPTASFTVDSDAGSVRKDGTYVVQCTLNKNSTIETKFTVELSRNAGVTIPGPTGPLSLRKLGMFESLEDTVSLPQVIGGWSTMLNRWLEYVRANATGGGGGSLLTTKGDLLTHDSLTDVRLPVGPDGDVLTADSTQPDGIKWAPPTGGGGGATVATWAINVPGYFCVDDVNGDDTRSGFGLTAVAAFANSVKTHDRLRAVVPDVGSGRIIVILGVSKAGGADYPTGLNLTGKVGYSYMLIRGTIDATNDAAERVVAGAVIQTAGPDTGGSWAVGAGIDVHNWTIGAGTFPTADSLLGYRIRWRPDTITVGLQNRGARFYTHTVGVGAQITSAQKQGSLGTTVPAAGDKFFVEKPGYSVPSLECRGCAQIMYVAGVNCSGAPFTSFQVAATRQTSIAFCTVVGQNVDSQFYWACQPAYIAEDGTSVSTGHAYRVSGSYGFSNLDTLILNQIDVTTPNGGRGISNCRTSSIGDASSTFAVMPTIYRCGTMAAQGGIGNVVGGGAANFFGNSGIDSITDLRTRVMGSAAASGILDSNFSVVHADLSNLGPRGLVFEGIGCNYSVDDVVGSTGNTDVGLDFYNCFNCSILFESRSAGNNTITGTNGDVKLPGIGATPVYANHADFRKASLGGDSNYNKVQGTGRALVGKVVALTCHEGGGITVGDSFFTEGASNNAKLSKADAVPTARVEGIAATTGVSTKLFYGVTGGGAYANLDAASTGSLLYLSAATAGKVTFTAPGGGAQVVPVARALDSDGVATSIHVLITPQATVSGAVSPLTTKGDVYTHDTLVDARLAVGANGQLLSADSTTATGLKWVNPPSGTSPLTTKGDIYTHDSTVDARLPVGSNGQVLTVDSTAATGVKWATPAAGGSGGTVLNFAETEELGADATEIVLARSDHDFTPFPGPNVTLSLSAWARNLALAAINTNATLRVRVGASAPNTADGTVVIGPLAMTSTGTLARINGSATIALPAGRQLITVTVAGGTDVGNAAFRGLFTAATLRVS